jgi:enediyne core biosynthesis thioesterase
MKYYEYDHTVSFEETNLFGNVYFTNHLKWQGRCREMFLRDHAPGVLQDITKGLQLATIRCICEYEEELFPFDRVVVRMSLTALKTSGLTLHFDYYRLDDHGETLVARGEQAISCLRRNGRETLPAPVPEELLEALRLFRGEAA